MKAIEELEGCLEGGDRILFETEHCCAFQRGRHLWFANDISDGGWFESKSLCEIASCYQHEITEAIRTEFGRVEEYYYDRATNFFRPRRGQKHLPAVLLTDAKRGGEISHDSIVLGSDRRVYWGLYTSEGEFKIIRQT